jgi:hypothetical protein
MENAPSVALETEQQKSGSTRADTSKPERFNKYGDLIEDQK